MLSWLPGDCNHKPENKSKRLMCGSHTADRERAKESGFGPPFPAYNAITLQPVPVTAMDMLWVSLLALFLMAPRQVQANAMSSAVPWNITHSGHGNTSAEPGPSGEGSVRLVNGSSRCSGAVEVHHRGRWMPVCQEMWDKEASHVVCRQLHCGEAKETAAEPTPSPVCPPRSTPTKEATLSFQNLCPSLHIHCAGLESTWKQCNVSELCCKGKLASITCTGSHSVRLVGGGSCCEGRVEVEADGVWGTVCDDAWDLDDAGVVCQQLKCGWAIQAPVASSFHKGTGPIHLDEVSCAGNESQLWDCPAERSHDCGHKEDAGVVCSEHQKWRLSGGKDACAGRVEVYYRGVWNTVCDGIWYEEEMGVLCRWLGCSPSGKKLSFNYTQEGRMSYLCSGTEASLSWCQWHYNNSNLCHQSQAAGVICNGSLGLLNMSDVLPTQMTTPDSRRNTAEPLCWEAKALSNWTLLLLCVVLGLLLLATVLAFTAALLRMRRKHAHAVSSSSLATPVLVNHSAQGPETPAGGANDYRKAPPKAEEPLAVPAPGSEDSDSDYEHYDFSSKPPVALSTFYNSLRHRAADETLPAGGFPPAPGQEVLNEGPQPWGQPEQRPYEEPPAESSSSSEDNYYNSGNTRQQQWGNPAPPPTSCFLMPAPPAHGNSGSQLSFQAGPDGADSSSTSSGEWYENFHSTAHQGDQPGNMPEWPALSQPLGSCEPGRNDSEGSDYDDVQGLAY
ncbi:T-cell differentiation antigen CD6 isoform X3 [Gopherus evgoodei]|uniref:T-cell differentiation antigen CD6 isoform X3 n=1 Tax=Gopherus evgoodei TaxID=1825980 RepID=UPI0011CEDC7D|nr:T-cell differentiation antigen CD6 isoform X3 [Gopherus evgoodei]